MKGQYLAIETVLTFGMGIAIALGTITAFTSYKDNMVDATVNEQVTTVESEIRDTVFQLENTDSGHLPVELPERLGESSYTVALDDGVKIFVQDRSYSSDFKRFDNYEFQGSIEGGGEAKIYKRNNQYSLRPD